MISFMISVVQPKIYNHEEKVPLIMKYQVRGEFVLGSGVGCRAMSVSWL